MRIDPEILQAVDKIQVIDTHEHQEEESDRLKRKLDFFSLFSHYAKDDLASAGMSDENLKKCESSDTPLDDKWRLFEPYYLAARNTAYLRAVQICIRDLYEIEELNSSNYAVLSERLQQRNKPGIVRHILKDRCNIRFCQVNGLTTGFFRKRTDAELFQQDLSVASLLSWPPPIGDLQTVTQTSITNFKSYADAIDKLFAMFAPYADAIKQQSAYWRPQSFADVPDADAARILEDALKDAKQVAADRRRALQDWAFHRCIRRCIDHDLPIKIHTGYEAGHNGMELDNIRPGLLAPLFGQYNRATFDVFHIGYPWQDEVLALAKQYGNVYADMCWTWIIDPQACCRFLKQFLVTAPSNKLFAFGGDYGYAEPVYGHLRIARNGIARVLSELVEEAWFTKDEAITIAHRILHDNAAFVFRADAKSEALRRLQNESD